MVYLKQYLYRTIYNHIHIYMYVCVPHVYTLHLHRLPYINKTIHNRENANEYFQSRKQSNLVLEFPKTNLILEVKIFYS